MIRLISLVVFGIGFLLFLVGSFQLTSNMYQPAQANDVSITSSAERSAAIKAAKIAGKKEYSFTTRFTPGVGVITKTEQYRNELPNQLQEAIETSNN